MKRTTSKLTLALLLAAGSAQQITADFGGDVAYGPAHQFHDDAPADDAVASNALTDVSADGDVSDAVEAVAHHISAVADAHNVGWQRDPARMQKMRANLQKFRSILRSQNQEDRQADWQLARKSMAVGRALRFYSMKNADDLPEGFTQAKKNFFKARKNFFTDEENHDQRRDQLERQFKRLGHRMNHLARRAEDESLEQRGLKRIARLAKADPEKFTPKAQWNRLQARLNKHGLGDDIEQLQEQAHAFAQEKAAAIAAKIAPRIEARIEKRIYLRKLAQLARQELREHYVQTHAAPVEEPTDEPDATAPSLDDTEPVVHAAPVVAAPDEPEADDEHTADNKQDDEDKKTDDDLALNNTDDTTVTLDDDTHDEEKKDEDKQSDE